MTDTVQMPKEMCLAILKVMETFGSLKKTDYNAHGKYKFAPVDDFYDRISKLLPRFGLVIIASEIESDLLPLTSTATDRNGNITGEKTTIWIKTKWQFKLCHNGVTYDAGFRYAMIPSSGPQTEGIAQSYATKNFMRDTFKVATGEYELDDMAPEEHGVPAPAVAARSSKKAEPPHDPKTGEVKQDSKAVARSSYNKIISDDFQINDAELTYSYLDDRLEDGSLTGAHYDAVIKVLHARKMIAGTKTFDMVERSREAIDAVPEYLRSDGKLATFLKAKEAEIAATQIPERYLENNED